MTDFKSNNTWVANPASSSQKLSSARLPVLKSSGPESNYLDWELVVFAYFDASGLYHIIDQPRPEHPSNTWIARNKLVFSIITQTIDASNIQYIREFCRDA